MSADMAAASHGDLCGVHYRAVVVSGLEVCEQAI
jgi:hypothetical protein